MSDLIKMLLDEIGFYPIEIGKYKERKTKLTPEIYYKVATEENEEYLKELKDTLKDLEVITDVIIPMMNKYIAMGYITAKQGKLLQSSINIMCQAIRELQFGELEKFEEEGII